MEAEVFDVPEMPEEPHYIVKVYPTGRIAWGDGRALTLSQLAALRMLVEGQHATTAAAEAFVGATAYVPEAR